MREQKGIIEIGYVFNVEYWLRKPLWRGQGLSDINMRNFPSETSHYNLLYICLQIIMQNKENEIIIVQYL